MEELYKKLLKKLAHFQVMHPYITVLLLVFLTIIIWGGISKVQTVASLEEMMPSGVEEIKAFDTLRDNHLGQDMIAIVFKINRNSTYQNGINDVRDQEVYYYLENLGKTLQKETDVIETYSYSNILQNKINQNTSKEEYNQIINSEELKPYVNDFISSDYSTTILLINTDVGADDMRMNLLSTKVKNLVSDMGIPPGLEVEYTGTPVIQQKLGILINQDRNNTQWISTLLVFLITMIIFRSLSSAIVPILVVFTSVNWLYGTMGYTNLPISTLAGGVAAMVIGIGIDFAIHLMNKFKYERKNKNSIKHSIELAVTQTGTALTITSLTTITAFLAFLFGVMPEMGRFGILMAIGIFYSLTFTLVGLPALLVIEEELIYKLKKVLRFGVEGEFHLEGGEKDALKDS
jgi:hypothetical protein